MKDAIKRILIIAAILIIVYMIASFLEIIGDNCSFSPHYSSLNFFVIITKNYVG